MLLLFSIVYLTTYHWNLIFNPLTDIDHIIIWSYVINDTLLDYKYILGFYIVFHANFAYLHILSPGR